jgi:hypothetical protein
MQVWDPRQKDVPVASLEPKSAEVVRPKNTYLETILQLLRVSHIHINSLLSHLVLSHLEDKFTFQLHRRPPTKHAMDAIVDDTQRYTNPFRAHAPSVPSGAGLLERLLRQQLQQRGAQRLRGLRQRRHQALRPAHQPDPVRARARSASRVSALS